MLNLKDNHYKQLSSIERFKLAVAAFSRGDDAEITRLKRTCPTKNYTMIDCEYTNRIAGLTWVITQFSEICEYSHQKITLCQSCITLLSSCSSDIKMGYFTEAKNQHISNLKSAHQALIEFCHENQLSPIDVLQWLKISPELTHQYDDCLVSGINTNKEFVAYAKEKFYSIWQSYVVERF